MGPVFRALLWATAIIAPGGFVLLPVLAADSVRRRREARVATAPAE